MLIFIYVEVRYCTFVDGEGSAPIPNSHICLMVFTELSSTFTVKSNVVSLVVLGYFLVLFSSC